MPATAALRPARPGASRGAVPPWPGFRRCRIQPAPARRSHRDKQPIRSARACGAARGAVAEGIRRAAGVGRLERHCRPSRRRRGCRCRQRQLAFLGVRCSPVGQRRAGRPPIGSGGSTGTGGATLRPPAGPPLPGPPGRRPGPGSPAPPAVRRGSTTTSCRAPARAAGAPGPPPATRPGAPAAAGRSPG